MGAVRCIFAIAWYRGSRHEQVLGLEMEDHLRTEHQVRNAIRKSRPTPGQAVAKPEWASIWAKFGCLFFKMEYAQKPGYDRVIPLDAILCAEIERYIKLRSEQGLPGSGPIFRYLQHDRALDSPTVREIIRTAERLARDECEADGHDPDLVFCEGVRPMHDARTAVANRWADMGWEHNKNSAWLGCWSTRVTVGGSQDRDYKQLNPYLVMALAEGKKLSEALDESGVADRAKAQATMVVPFD